MHFIKYSSVLFLGLALSACGNVAVTPVTPTPVAPPTPPAVNPTYTVKGSVTGLSAGTSLTLSNNGATVTSDSSGNFAFTAITSGAAYNVTVPTPPTDYTCAVQNGSGTMGDADVTGVNVTCTPPVNSTHAVGGLVVNSSSQPGFGYLVLNAGTATEETLLVQSGASFVFKTRLKSGDTYSVTGKPPATSFAAYCVVTGNGSGTIASADVTEITVACYPPRLPPPPLPLPPVGPRP